MNQASDAPIRSRNRFSAVMRSAVGFEERGLDRDFLKNGIAADTLLDRRRPGNQSC